MIGGDKIQAACEECLRRVFPADPVDERPIDDEMESAFQEAQGHGNADIDEGYLEAFDEW